MIKEGDFIKYSFLMVGGEPEIRKGKVVVGEDTNGFLCVCNKSGREDILFHIDVIRKLNREEIFAYLIES